VADEVQVAFEQVEILRSCSDERCPKTTGFPSAPTTTEVPRWYVSLSESSCVTVIVRVATLAVADAVPVPAALTAETRNVYVVECERPVTVVDAVVEVPSVNVVHVEPLSDEYSTV
jgi:hypothetical protein